MGTFSQIEHLGRFFIRNLVVYPLVFKGKGGDGVLTLDEAVSKNAVNIQDNLGVDSITLINRGNSPLLILEGESLLGARQDRIFNTTSVVEADVREILPVSCVEKERWSGNSTFKTSIALAFPSLRSVLRSTVTANLISRGIPKSDQNSIWRLIDKTLNVTRTMSKTKSMHDAYDTLKSEIDRYIEELGEIQNVTGYMVFAGDKFIALDVFSSYELLKKYEKKLFASYAMQGILERYGFSGLKKTGVTPEGLGEMDEVEIKAFRKQTGWVEGRGMVKDILIELIKDSSGRMLYASLVPAPLESLV